MSDPRCRLDSARLVPPFCEEHPQHRRMYAYLHVRMFHLDQGDTIQQSCNAFGLGPHQAQGVGRVSEA